VKMGTELLPEKLENHILTRLFARENFIVFCHRESFKTCLTVNMFSHDFSRRKWLASSSFMSMKNALEGIRKDEILA